MSQLLHPDTALLAATPDGIDQRRSRRRDYDDARRALDVLVDRGLRSDRADSPHAQRVAAQLAELWGCAPRVPGTELDVLTAGWVALAANTREAVQQDRLDAAQARIALRETFKSLVRLLPDLEDARQS